MEIFGTDARIVGGVALAVAAVVLYGVHKAQKNSGAIGQAIDPTNANNLAYRGVNAVGAAITGSPDFSLGVWAWEVLHPLQNARDNNVNAPVNLTPALPDTSGYYGTVGA